MVIVPPFDIDAHQYQHHNIVTTQSNDRTCDLLFWVVHMTVMMWMWMMILMVSSYIHYLFQCV